MYLKDIPGIQVLKSDNKGPINVFVCGGGNNVGSFFYEDAYKVGKKLAELGVGFANGGYTERGNNMGESYFGYKENGGQNSSLIARKVFRDDIKPEFESVWQAATVDDIAGLLKAQYLLSDIAVILPGGTGTMLELFGYMELPLDYRDKRPITILYNKLLDENHGFWDLTIKQTKLMKNCGFISKDPFETFIEVSTIEELLNALEIEVNKALKTKSSDMSR